MPLTCGSGSAPGFTRRFACNKQIIIRVDASAAHLAADVQDARDIWNAVLDDPRTPGLPTFHYTTSTSGTADILVKATGTATVYCGGFDPGTGVLTLQPSGQCGAAPNRDGPLAAIVHEFTEAYGFGPNLEKAGQPGISDHCANHLPDDGGLNDRLCQHEIEYILKAYGFRTAAVSDDASFWGKSILTDFAVSPNPVSFTATNATTQLSLANIDFANQLIEPAVSLNQLSLIWSSSAENIAAVGLTSGLVTAKDNGSATIQAKITGGLPSNVQLGGLAARLGASVPVTVTATTPPPGTGFRVTGTTGAATPIHFADTYGLTAQVVNAPAGQLRIKWIVTYSNGVLPNDETAYGPNAYTLSVAEGSYNIRVTAMPLVAVGGGAPPAYGTPAIVDFPVCTGGGDGPPPLLQAALPDGDEVPSAVGGC